DGHLERHIGVFALAMAVGLLVVAWHPERARAMLPILGGLVAGLIWSCFGDIWAGRPVPGNLVAHGADIAGLAAVWLLARTDGHAGRVRRPRARGKPDGSAASGRCWDERGRPGYGSGRDGSPVVRHLHHDRSGSVMR